MLSHATSNTRGFPPELTRQRFIFVKEEDDLDVQNKKKKKETMLKNVPPTVSASSMVETSAHRKTTKLKKEKRKRKAGQARNHTHSTPALAKDNIKGKD
ncbi:hypothetical protein VTH06DRAFT_8488 [Thermothelomyces fergusii]